jgi:hypothetical protein
MAFKISRYFCLAYVDIKDYTRSWLMRCQLNDKFHCEPLNVFSPLGFNFFRCVYLSNHFHKTVPSECMEVVGQEWGDN